MKARLPKDYNKGNNAPTNLQQLAKQAQKMQEEMDEASNELDVKEYSAAAGGGAVNVVVTGKMEVKRIDINPEIVDPDDVEILADAIAAAVNEAIRAATAEKEEVMTKISGGLNMPGLF